jgi:hypothetical protein
MKKLLFSACMLACIAGYADQTFLKPLWQEEEHFAYYRVICIEGSISKIGILIQEARDNPTDISELLNDMEQEIKNCKNCL